MVAERSRRPRGSAGLPPLREALRRTRRSLGAGGQACDHGFALAALLVAIAILSIMMLVALPTWRHLAQREKEAELVFRGEQYARAIGLYQRKHPGAFPASLDVLVDQKFLRKKYKDPITGEDFVPVMSNSAEGRAAMQQAMSDRTNEVRVEVERPGGRSGLFVRVQPPGQSPSAVPSVPSGPGQVRFQVQRGGRQIEIRANVTFVSGTRGGIVGVTSKSTEESIRLYKGRDRYNQWMFIYIPASPQAGQGPEAPPPPGVPPPPPPPPGRGRGGL